MNKLIVCTLALALGGSLAGCSSSGSSGTASSASSSTASSTGGAASGGGAGVDGGAGTPASARDLCAEVPATEVAALTGEKISTASPISEGSRFRTGFDGPSCVYKPASGLGGVSAEFVSAESYDGLVSDPMLKLTPMAGVGDEAFQALDQIDGTTVIRTLATKGDDHLLVMIFSGTAPENAKELTAKLLG